jgi:hypothetical protein
MTRAARGVRRSAACEVERNVQRWEGLLEGARRRVLSNKTGNWKWSKRGADKSQVAGEGGLYQTERRLHGDVMIAIQ